MSSFRHLSIVWSIQQGIVLWDNNLERREECKLSLQAFTEKSMDFQTKIIERSGLGDETYLPDGARIVHIHS
jgi:hypothetical protein